MSSTPSTTVSRYCLIEITGADPSNCNTFIALYLMTKLLERIDARARLLNYSKPLYRIVFKIYYEIKKILRNTNLKAL